MTVIDRSKEYHQEQSDMAINAIESRQDTTAKDLYGYFIKLSQESIRLHQEMLALDGKLRDRTNQADLETLELIWNNMNLSQDIIRQEMENIAHYREEVKHAVR